MSTTIVPTPENDGISEVADPKRVAHESWCTAHVYPSPEVGEQGWCRTGCITHGVDILLVTDVDTLGGQSGIDIDGDDKYLTGAQVRDVAHELLRMADLIDPLTRDKVTDFLDGLGLEPTDEALAALGVGNHDDEAR